MASHEAIQALFTLITSPRSLFVEIHPWGVDGDNRACLQAIIGEHPEFLANLPNGARAGLRRATLVFAGDCIFRKSRIASLIQQLQD